MKAYLLILCVVVVLLEGIEAFQLRVPPHARVASQTGHSFLLLSQSADDSSSPSEPEDVAEEIPAFKSSTVRMDDGGSDLTNRFKYKVNALMGVFDPPNPDVDNDQSTGNILNAMLTFPVNYSFNVVGKTNGDDQVRDEFIQKVKNVVQNGSGDSIENIVCQVTPRGKKFVKVTVQAQVDSAGVISSIYEELEQLEMSVMQF